MFKLAGKSIVTQSFPWRKFPIIEMFPDFWPLFIVFHDFNHLFGHLKSPSFICLHLLAYNNELSTIWLGKETAHLISEINLLQQKDMRN